MNGEGERIDARFAVVNGYEWGEGIDARFAGVDEYERGRRPLRGR